MNPSQANHYPLLHSRIVQGEVHISAERPAPANAFSFDDTPALTAALRAGDEAAYRWLYEQRHARLSRYCFALARGNEALAGEIAQATYLRLIRHVKVLPDESALWSWLACAARSAATDLGRTGNRYRGALARFGDWLHLGRQAPSANSGDDTETILIRALDTVLGHLSAEERELINARYFEHVPLEEIAGRLNTTARAIEGRLARLRQRLRERIAAELKHDSRS